MCSLPFVCVFHLLTNPLPFARALYVFRSSPFVTNQNTTYLNVLLLLHSDTIAKLSTLYITTIASINQSLTTFYYTLKLVQRTYFSRFISSLSELSASAQAFTIEPSAFWCLNGSTVLKALYVMILWLLLYNILLTVNVFWYKYLNNVDCRKTAIILLMSYPLFRYICT